MRVGRIVGVAMVGLIVGAGAGAQEPLVLAQEGVARAVIVPAEGNAVAAFAAAELERYLEQITGADFEVAGEGARLPREEGEGAAGVAGMARILIGDCPEARAAGLDVSTLKRDGSWRAVVGNDLLLLGRDQSAPVRMRWNEYVEMGSLFAVYDFLEDVCGVRFIKSGPFGEVVPPAATLTVPRDTVRDEPVFLDRSFYPFSARGYDLPDADAHEPAEGDTTWPSRTSWGLKLRWETQKMVAGCHSAHYLDFDKRFAADHPDWFALLPNGERAINTPRGSYLCYSQPGLIQAWIDDARAYFAGEPPQSRGLTTWNKGGYGVEFMVDPHDSYPYCQCEDCQRVYRADPEQDFSEIIFGAVARVAEAVSDFDGRYISTLAYGPKVQPPKTVTLPDNVRVRLCVNGALYHSMPGTRDTQLDLVRRWSERMEGDLVLWIYPDQARPGKPIAGVPEIAPHAMAEFLRAVRPYVAGCFFENESTAETFRFLDEYITMKLLWDPEQDVDALLADYFRSFYGPAAEPISALYARLEELWRQVYTIYGGDRPRFASRVDLWEKIYTEEELERLSALVTRAEELARGDEAYAWRVALMREEMVGRLQRNRQTYERELGVAAQTESTCYRAQAAPDADGLLPMSAWEGVRHEVLRPAMGTEGLHVLTHFKTSWTPEALHLLIEAEEPDPGNSATKLDREADDPDLWTDQTVEFMLTCEDPRIMSDVRYHVLINDRGVVADLSNSLGASDWGWDSGATVAVERTESGWVARVAAPWAAMGIADPEALGRVAFNVVRHRARRNLEPEYYSWSQAPEDGGWTESTLHGQLIFSADAPPPEPENLLQNGSLDAPNERGLWFAGWASPSSNADNIFRDSLIRWDGAAAARLEATEPEAVTLLQYVDAVQPGRTYRFSCKVRLENIEAAEAGHNGAYVNFCAPNFNEFVPATALTGTSDWRNIEFEATTADAFPEGRRPYIRLKIDGCTGTAWFDEARLIEIR